MGKKHQKQLQQSENQQIYYVGKHGNDTENTGKEWDNEAFLTFGKAITEIALQSPSILNQFTIRCKDSGIYNEQIAVPSFVNIDAPNAELRSTNSTGHTLDISLAQENVINFHIVQAQSSDATVSARAESTSNLFLNINSIINNGSGYGLETLDGYVNGIINNCQKLYVAVNSEINIKINRLIGGATLVSATDGSLVIGHLISGTIDKQTGSNVTVEILNPSVLLSDLIIGSSTINASAQFQIDSTTKGFLPPRMTTAQRNAIANPATGLRVYDTDEKCDYFYNGTIWQSLCVSEILNTTRLSVEQVGETFTPSFTLATGSFFNRFVFLGIGVDNYGTADWSDIKYAGKSMRRIASARQSFDNNVLDFFYMIEEDLVAITGSNAISITFTAQPDNANKMGYIWGVYNDVNQITPFRTIHKVANQSASQLDVDILDCSIDDHVIGIGFGDDNTGTFVVSSPFTKEIEATFQTGRVTISDAIATATTTNCEYTSSGAVGIGIVGFGLKGVGK